MKCINCGSEWNATGKAAVSITNCPFCGESPVVKKAEPKTYETSKRHWRQFLSNSAWISFLEN